MLIESIKWHGRLAVLTEQVKMKKKDNDKIKKSIQTSSACGLTAKIDMGKPTSDFSLKRGIKIDKHDSLSIFHRIKNLII